MKNYTTLLLVMFSFSFLPSAFAAETVHLKLSGQTQGKSKGDGWIDVLSVKWMSPESLSKKQYKRAQSAAGSDKIKLTRRIDKSSPKLQEACNSGTSLGDMSLLKGGVEYSLQDVKVVSVQRRGDTEIVSLSCRSVSPTTSTRAAPANHNTTRSNRLAPAQAGSKAQDYNSSRSNRGG